MKTGRAGPAGNVLLGAALFVCVFARTAAAQTQWALDTLISNETTWAGTPDQVMAGTRGMQFRWTSTTKESARSVFPGLTYAGKRVLEAVVWFSEGTVREIFLSLYNRADSGPLSETELDRMAGAFVEEIGRRTGVSPTIREFKSVAGGIPRKTAVWPGKTLTHQLDWAWTVQPDSLRSGGGFRAEYVRLRVISTGGERVKLTTEQQKVSALALSDRKLTRRPNGDVCVEGVPMVNQGMKGYCVSATLERILRYYGTAIDQHQIAQIANTDKIGGTDPTSMLRALRAASVPLQIKVTVLEEFDARKFLRVVDDYNKAAKAMHAPQFDLKGQRMINMGAVFAGMNREAYLESRTSNAAPINGFMTKISRSIDRRVPVMWCVILGFVPEPGLPQAAGGHMRLIIGYNNKTREILYSDSWGAGHEEKRMAVDKAYAIGTLMATVEPR